MLNSPQYRGRRGSQTATLALTVALSSTVLAVPVATATATATATAPVDCGGAQSLTANADTWVDQSSPSTNGGADSILKLRSQAPTGNFRALVRFPTPLAVPAGCVLDSAVLRLYAASPDEGRTLQAFRLASAWSERSVTWENQPATLGGPAVVASAAEAGYLEWKVTSLLLDGAGDGFLIRDAVEGDSGEQSFHALEKGESPPQLVVRYAPPPDPMAHAPQPPEPAAVTCGQVITRSTLVKNSLAACPGDGLVIGAPGIIVDLNGQTLDGVGLGSGIRNDGHDLVTVRMGVVRDFDYGVQLTAGTARGLVEHLTLELNQIAAIQLSDADGPEGGNQLRFNTAEGNGLGIVLKTGTTDAVVSGNTLLENAGEGVVLDDSHGNRVEDNSFTGGSDGAVELFGSSNNLLRGNIISGSGDGGVDVVAGSHDNRIEGNVLVATGDSGVFVSESDRNQLVANTAKEMSDSGIVLSTANDSVVRGNDLRFNPTGLELSGANRTLVIGNDASESSGIGMEIAGGSFVNHVLLNNVSSTGGDGISVADDAQLADGLEPGTVHANVLERNTTSDNLGDGIHVAKPGHLIASNIARRNGGWGIWAADPGTRSDTANIATHNGYQRQCFGLMCLSDAQLPPDGQPPETSITSGPEDNTIETHSTFLFTAADDRTDAGELRFECRLDDGPFAACTSPVNLTHLDEGAHTFEVRAIDAAGNVDSSPADDTWTVIQPSPPTDCGPPITIAADADTWLDQGSRLSNNGRDSVLKVRTQGASDNFRTLVRFALSDRDARDGCSVESATLRLYAGGAKEGRTLQALRVTGAWLERGVTWASQPGLTGPAALTPSGKQWLEWLVTDQVQEMYDGDNHGFLIRDAIENGRGDEQSLHSREKTDDYPPQLVVRFAAERP